MDFDLNQEKDLTLSQIHELFTGSESNVNTYDHIRPCLPVSVL